MSRPRSPIPDLPVTPSPSPSVPGPAGGSGGVPEIALQNPNRYPEVDTAALGAWLEALVSTLDPEADSLAVRFAGDRLVRRINRRYRDRDRPTDVLSFPGGATPEGRHLGDVLISVPAARRQAPVGPGEEPSVAVRRELQRLLLHGVLHCLGYDHEGDDGEMERLEARLRREWIDGGA